MRAHVRIAESVTLGCSPSAAFQWIADPERAVQWQLGVLEYEITHATPERVGTTFREVVGDEKGRVELRGEVTAYVPDSVMEFALSGRGLRVLARYVVTPHPDGSRLDVVSDVRLGGRLSFLLAPFARGNATRQLRTELARLRALCGS